MEGAHFIKSGDLTKLSESQLVDCDKTSSGCNGGLEIWAFAYAKKHAVELEKTYPYIAKDEPCTYKKDEGKVAVAEYKTIEKRSVVVLKHAVEAGPTCVSVDAANKHF